MSASTPPAPARAEIPKPPAHLEAKIRARVADDASRSPSTRTLDRRLASVLAVCALGEIGFLIANPRADWALLPRAPWAVTTGALAIGALGSLALAARRGRFGLGPSAPIATTVAMFAVPFYLIVGVVHPLTARGGAALNAPPLAYDEMLACASHCALAAVLVGGLLLLALALLLRRTTPVIARARGAALGAASGLVGVLALHLHCAVAEQGHLLLGHALPIALLGLVGASLASRALDA